MVDDGRAGLLTSGARGCYKCVTSFPPDASGKEPHPR